MPKPTVHIIATGGSIAGVGPDRMDYIRYPEIGDHLTIDQNLARVPEIAENFNVIAEDMVSVGSTAIGPANWIALAERIHAIDREEPDTAGVVITHGTATLEETAYFPASDGQIPATGCDHRGDASTHVDQHGRRP